MSKELEDEFGAQIMALRELDINSLREMLIGNIRKKAGEEEKRVKAFCDSLTVEQKEEFIYAFKWGLDSAFFGFLTFLEQGSCGVEIKLEASYKGETEVLADRNNGCDLSLCDLYWEWLDQSGEKVH